MTSDYQIYSMGQPRYKTFSSLRKVQLDGAINDDAVCRTGTPPGSPCPASDVPRDNRGASHERVEGEKGDWWEIGRIRG